MVYKGDPVKNDVTKCIFSESESELLSITKPLMNWIRKNYDDNSRVEVSAYGAVLVVPRLEVFNQDMLFDAMHEQAKKELNAAGVPRIMRDVILDQNIRSRKAYFLMGESEKQEE